MPRFDADIPRKVLLWYKYFGIGGGGADNRNDAIYYRG